MAISPVTILSVTEVGSPAQFLRVRFEHPASERANLARFAIHVDEVDDPPVWTEPPAVDLGIPQDDGGSPMEMREVLWWIAEEIATEHETFEEYAVGDVAGRQLDRGGGYAMWDGAAVVGQNDLGLRGTEDFEDYPVGVVPVLDGGIGWDGAAVVKRPRWMFAVSGTRYVTATSVSETVPASVQVGDLLLAFVMHRGALTTTPSGWTLVVSDGGNYSGSGIPDQYLSVFKRTAQVGDGGTSIAFEVGASGRMGIHIMSVAPDGVPLDVVSNQSVSISNANMSTTAMAGGTLSGDGMIVAGITFVTAISPSTITPPSGYVLSTPGSVGDNRMGAAFKLSEGETASGNWGFNTTANNGGAVITLIIKEVP
jgi:hypothetical protein